MIHKRLLLIPLDPVSRPNGRGMLLQLVGTTQEHLLCGTHTCLPSPDHFRLDGRGRVETRCITPMYLQPVVSAAREKDYD